MESRSLAPEPVGAPLEVGTRVELDPGATLLDGDLLAGGTPWRLLRLPGATRSVVERWRGGGVVGPGEARLARTLVQQGLLHPRFPPAPDLSDVDVIVPVRDDVANLRSLLGELRGLEVTVVDDGSEHPGPVAECCERQGVAVVRLPVNLGPAAARNAGARATTRPFLWFLDVDVDIDNALEVGRRLRGEFRDPLVAAVAPRIRGRAGARGRERFEQHFSPLDRGPRSGLVRPDSPLAYVPSASLLVRRDAFGDGFDESLRVGEDVDFVWRLSARGWLVRYRSEIVVTHRVRPTWAAWWRQRVRYGESASQLATRHGDAMAPLRVERWSLLVWLSWLARVPLVGGQVLSLAQRQIEERLGERGPETQRASRHVVRRSMVSSAAPFSRALVRTYGPLVLLAALHPRLRRRALGIFALGTAWRWRDERFDPRDLPLAIGDDLAYSVGVTRGAWRDRSWAALRPRLVASSLRLRDVLRRPLS